MTFPAWLLQPSSRSFPGRATGQATQPFIPAKWRGRPASTVHLNGCCLGCSTVALLSDFNSPLTSDHSASNLFLSSLCFFVFFPDCVWLLSYIRQHRTFCWYFLALILSFWHFSFYLTHCLIFFNFITCSLFTCIELFEFLLLSHHLSVSFSFISICFSLYLLLLSPSFSLWISSPSRCPSGMSSVGWNKYEEEEG